MPLAQNPSRLIEAFRLAAKAQWPLRFGQLLLSLLRDTRTNPIDRMQSISDDELTNLLLAANGTPYKADIPNTEWHAFHLRNVRGDAAREWSVDLRVFLPLADSFAEALRTAKTRAPSMPFGQIAHEAFVGRDMDPAGRLHYLYREDSIRLLHGWTNDRTRHKRVWP